VLPDGVGLRVVEVVPDSPAELELETGDILHKLGDQLLIEPGQLAVLVGLKAPGEAVELSWYRDGKPLTARITLGERPPPRNVQHLPVRPDPRGLPGLMPLAPPMLPDGFGGMEERMLEMERRMEALREEMERGFQGGAAGTATTRRRVEVREGDSAMVIEVEDGHATLRVEEDGKVVFDGPVNTPQERAGVPEPYRDRLEEHLGGDGQLL
jgi:hypothetical protein